MSKSIRIILLFVGIGLFSSIIYFALNSTNDSTSYPIMPIELKVAEKLHGGSVWYFSGSVHDSETEIKLSVRSPDGNIITTDTIIPSENGNFEVKITTGGPLWKNAGKYLLILEQGEFKEIHTFKILENEISIPIGDSKLITYCCPTDESLTTIFSIHERIEKNGNRLAISPQNKVLNLTNTDTVTFVNDGVSTVNIFDKARGLWSFENVAPSSQRNLIINNTGYYEILVQDSRHGIRADIVALSENTNSLPVEIRAKMAQIFLRTDFHKGNEVISVGSGSAEPGLTIGIHEKFQDIPDAEQFYYEKYRNMIPFDVPIRIEFTEPIVPQTR